MKKIKNSSKTKKESHADYDPLDRDLSHLFNEENIKKWVRVRYELQPKSKSITIRMGEALLTAVKNEAEKKRARLSEVHPTNIRRSCEKSWLST